MLKEYFIRQAERRLDRKLNAKELNTLLIDLNLTIKSVSDLIDKKLDAYIKERGL